MRKSVVPVFIALILAGFGAAPAGAQTVSITQCGTVIDDPGSYTLANDLLNCPEHGVVIRLTSNVTLNLNGRTIDGDEPSADGNGTGLKVRDATMVTVIGTGTIQQFRTGFLSRDAQNVAMNGAVMINNNVGTGARFRDTTNGTLTGATLSSNGSWGADVRASDHVILDVDSMNNDDGIRVRDESDDTDIVNGTVSGSDNGIRLRESTANTVSGNSVTNNDVGLRARDASGSVTGNSFSGNGCDLELEDGTGGLAVSGNSPASPTTCD